MLKKSYLFINKLDLRLYYVFLYSDISLSQKYKYIIIKKLFQKSITWFERKKNYYISYCFSSKS